MEKPNFLKGLRKIKNLLPLLPKNDYYKSCSDVAFSYKDVDSGVASMPKYITWDNVIDVFLTKQIKSSVLQKNFQSNEINEIDPEDFYSQNRPVESSINSSVRFEDGDSFQK